MINQQTSTNTQHQSNQLHPWTTYLKIFNLHLSKSLSLSLFGIVSHVVETLYYRYKSFIDLYFYDMTQTYYCDNGGSNTNGF